MRYLLILAIVGILPIIGFYVGVAAAKSRGDFSRSDRRELERRRDFMSQLGADAAEHAMLGDNFAVIVQSNLNAERKKR